MSASVNALNFKDHGELKIKQNSTFAHVNSQQVLPLIVHEFSQASAEMPVVFVKNSENDDFQAVGIMGFKEGENVFYSEEKWRGSYVPAYATHHPFALIPMKQDQTKLQVIISESSNVLSLTEGEALFDDKGNETAYMKRRKETLGVYYENMHSTRAFVKALDDKGLLKQQTLTVDIKGNKMSLSGLYLVDEEKLNKLSDKDFLDIKNRGFLAPIYSHLGSLHQLNRLAYFKTLADKK